MKTISSENIYQGHIKLVKDLVELEDGTKCYREVVKSKNAVCIALKLPNGNYAMVKQYRYPIKQEILEFCAGLIDEGENPKEAVIRECQEELGYTIKKLKSLGSIYTSCGISAEKIYLFSGVAQDFVGQHFDKDERLEVEEISYKKLLEKVYRNEITDAKTLCLISKIQFEKNVDNISKE